MLSFYKGKKVFITGHSGFKGAWLTLWLNSLGAEVLGYSLRPETTPDLYTAINLQTCCHSMFANILDKKDLNNAMQDFCPDMVFHLAAQPLVRKSYEEPLLTYETNVIGTLNVLEAARACSAVKAFINVTTDKCYENIECTTGYKEDDILGGYDMYSSSKACSEIMSASYRRSFLNDSSSFSLATVRAGNVIGGGDWSSDRLIPDFIQSLAKNIPIKVRNPSAIRPWQHVLEPLYGYLVLGQKLFIHGKEYAQAFNFGPEESNVTEVLYLVEKLTSAYGNGEIIIDEQKHLHEANILLLNSQKAKMLLGWKPVFDLCKTVELTADWYKKYYDETKNMQDFTLEQIKYFEGLCNGRTEK